MNFLRSIYYRRLSGENARRTYIKCVSLACRILSVQTLEGKIGDTPMHVSTRDTWGLRKFYFKKGPDMLRNIEMLKSVLKGEDGFVFWDIGANYGAFSLLLSPYATSTVSVEPCSETFRCLSRSCKEAEARVVLENCAVGEQSGQSMLYLSSHHFGDHRIYSPPDEGRRKTETVSVRTIDDIADSRFPLLPEKNLMKIDVQRAEVAVLRGAKRLISNSRTVFIFLEVWPKGLTEIGTSLDELIDVCAGYGLAPTDGSGQYCSWDSIATHFDCEAAQPKLDVLLTRSP